MPPRSPRLGSPQSLPRSRKLPLPFNAPNSPEFRGTSNGGAPTALTSLPAASVSFPSSPQAARSGDLVIWLVQVSQTFTGTISASTSNPNGIVKHGQGAQGTDNWVLAVFYEITDGVNKPTFTWDGTSHNTGWAAIAYSNFDSVTPHNISSAYQTAAVFQTQGGIGVNPMPVPTRQDTLMLGLLSNVNSATTNPQSPVWIPRLDNGVFAILEQRKHLADLVPRPIVLRSAASRDVSVLTFWNPPAPVVSAGGTLFTQGLTASVTVSRSMVKSVGKPLTRGLTISRALTKQIGKPLTRGLTISRSLTKQIGKPLTRGLTISRSLTKQIGKPLTRGLTVSRSLTKRVGKTLSDSVAITATLAASRVFLKTLAKTITITPSLRKQIGKPLTRTVTISRSLAKSVGKTLTRGLTIGRSLTKRIGKTLINRPGYSNVVLADGAASYWRLGEVSGTTATDVTGARSGTYSGAPVLAQPGTIFNDYAVSFGAADFVALGSGALFSGNNLSAEIWINTTSGASGSILDARTVGAGQRAGVNFFYAAGIVGFWIGGGGTAGVQGHADDPTTCNDGNWHQFVGTYDGTTIRLYRDGNPTPVATAALAVTVGYGATPVGRLAVDTLNRHYIGRLDEVSIYNSVLTPTQVTNHWNVGSGSFPITAKLTRRIGKTLSDLTAVSAVLRKQIGKRLAKPVTIIASLLRTTGAPPPEELPTFIAFGPNTQTAAIATKHEAVAIGSYKTLVGLSNLTTGAAIAPRHDTVTVVDPSPDADILYG